jgi:hypothetical protein
MDADDQDEAEELGDGDARGDRAARGDVAAEGDVAVQVTNVNRRKEQDHCNGECSNCVQRCVYTVEELTLERLVTQSQVNKELGKHGHPQCRKWKEHGKEKNRNTAQAKEELLSHYRKSHGIQI